MPIPLSADLSYEDLKAGWQKVANEYGSVHVFRLTDGRHLAATNRAQGVGEFVETIAPVADTEEQPKPSTEEHGLGAVPGRCSHGVIE